MCFFKKLIMLNVIIILAINAAFSASVNDGFSGEWCWDKNGEESSFSIKINKVSDLYLGAYDSVAFGGNIIDDNEHAFSFKETTDNFIKTKIKAGITGNVGIISLEILNNKKIKWLLLRKPQGDFYAPKEAILHKCS